jgi:5-methylcytosine-specific restriction endonuclease McrA
MLSGARRKFCSPLCLDLERERIKREEGRAGASEISVLVRYGVVNACLIYYFTCIDCGAPIVRKWKRPGLWANCRPCAKVRYRAHNAKKNHKRRALGPRVMSVEELAARDGARCHICHRKVDMALSGRAKWGPTIDHLVPVKPRSGPAGTNDPSNLALAHWHCNISRGNRGSAQLMLTA